MQISKEKQDILKQTGNILVVANPGTGKTQLLAFKYIDLIKNNIPPKDILCLTFTTKARKEMKERIVSFLSQEKINVPEDELNVKTFHSYCLENLEDVFLIPTNFLRYQIYKFLVNQNFFNYQKQKLINDLVPHFETLIHYVKSFGILPSHLEQAFDNLKQKQKDEEILEFMSVFIKVYNFYEIEKNKLGIDYADFLLKFLSLLKSDKQKQKKYKYVLVDELQDVNRLEAEIALLSAQNFFVVGDKKQAIFGFQGGSITNFSLFSNSKKFVLSENYRSTNNILDFAKHYFITQTNDTEQKKEVRNLYNPIAKQTKVKPMYILSTRDNYLHDLLSLIKKISNKKSNIAILCRTNSQIKKIARFLDQNNIEFSFGSSLVSMQAREDILIFIKALFSDDVSDIKQAMTTPFFPISLKEVFELSNNPNLSLSDVLNLCPSFAKLREINSKAELLSLFDNKILPISFRFEKPYFFTAVNLKNTLIEAFELVDFSLPNIFDYLSLSNIEQAEQNNKEEKQIMLSTVHKAKGRQFDKVIYLPKKASRSNKLNDAVKILLSYFIDVEKEIDEEEIRIHFVAFTRAMKELYLIFTSKSFSLFFNNFIKEMIIKSSTNTNYNSKPIYITNKAFSLFINKEYEKSKQLLNNNEKWLINWISNYFSTIKNISFSLLYQSPVDLLYNYILNMSSYGNMSMSFGQEIHTWLNQYLKDQNPELPDNALFKSTINNAQQIINELKVQKYKPINSEVPVSCDLNKLLDKKLSVSWNFYGKIDVIFKNQKSEYLLLDWKTNRNYKYSLSKHKSQLDAYAHAFSISKNVPLNKIKTRIAYICLRSGINISTQPIKYYSVENNVSKKINRNFQQHLDKLYSWYKDPHLFLQDLKSASENTDDVFLKTLLEQYEKEIK